MSELKGETTIATIVAIVEDLIQDWGLDPVAPIDADTLLAADQKDDVSHVGRQRNLEDQRDDDRDHAVESDACHSRTSARRRPQLVAKPRHRPAPTRFSVR